MHIKFWVSPEWILKRRFWREKLSRGWVYKQFLTALCIHLECIFNVRLQNTGTWFRVTVATRFPLHVVKRETFVDVFCTRSAERLERERTREWVKYRGYRQRLSTVTFKSSPRSAAAVPSIQARPQN